MNFIFIFIFRFYSNFDFYNFIISPCFGRKYPKYDPGKSIWKNTSDQLIAGICIQDPFKKCCNISKNVSILALFKFVLLCNEIKSFDPFILRNGRNFTQFLNVPHQFSNDQIALDYRSIGRNIYPCICLLKIFNEKFKNKKNENLMTFLVETIFNKINDSKVFRRKEFCLKLTSIVKYPAITTKSRIISFGHLTFEVFQEIQIRSNLIFRTISIYEFMVDIVGFFNLNNLFYVRLISKDLTNSFICSLSKDISDLICTCHKY